MRMGIREKLIISFSVMLILPIFVVSTIGLNAQNTSAVLTVVQIITALLIPFCVCGIVLGWIISKSILKPLDELDTATKEIMDGNFEFEISYNKNDEIGDLCTAFDLMREQLKISLEKQAALEYSRKELIASISHDLRTPMTSIKGYVEGLKDGIVHDKEKFNRYITIIKNKTESLDILIKNLFEYSQLDIIDSKEAFCIRDSKELLEAIIDPIEMEFADQPIQMEVTKPYPSVKLYVNEGNIAQVFDNLISNAKRHVDDRGTITIEVRADSNYLEVAISDNGTGILQEDLPHVFDNFYRAEKSRSRNFGGAGLGLAICKKITENHGGKIWVESIPNSMTKFSFILPIIK